MECENRARNSTLCNCTYPGCPRHGVCCECIAYHRRRNELPACYFSKEEERTYDRGIASFVSRQRRDGSK